MTVCGNKQGISGDLEQDKRRGKYSIAGTRNANINAVISKKLNNGENG
jgi:hypothetical protein